MGNPINIEQEEAANDELLEYQNMCNECSDLAYSIAHTEDLLHKKYFIRLIIEGLEINDTDLNIVQQVLNEVQQGNHT